MRNDEGTEITDNFGGGGQFQFNEAGSQMSAFKKQLKGKKVEASSSLQMTFSKN